MDLIEEINKLEKEIESNKIKTEFDKNRFISKIRTGLGEEIKNNPNKVIVIKKSKFQRLKESISKKISYIFKMF
jgi:hypothetical protein